MSYQESMIDVTQKAADEAFRYAVAVPEDKVEWKPLDQGRSVLDQAREMAKCPVWAVSIISSDGPPSFDPDSMAKERQEMETWSSVAQCKEICQQNLDKLFEVFRTISDERLVATKWLPFDGGRDFTVKEMMAYPMWNFTWHAGQIAYVQTLYGDKDMH